MASYATARQAKYGDQAAQARGMKLVVRIEGTDFRCYCNTEENAQRTAARLQKLPKRSRPGDVGIFDLESGEPVGQREVAEGLTLRKYEDVGCPTCLVRRGEKCRTPNETPTSAHAKRRQESKHH